MRNYRRIEAWRLADDLACRVYNLTGRFPAEERYGLISQLRRAVVSVAANIVEGASRETTQDYLHFLTIARGSLSETHYLMHLATRLGYLEKDMMSLFEAEFGRAMACLNGLMRAVASRPGSRSTVLRQRAIT